MLRLLFFFSCRYVKVARGYLLERRHPFLNRILGKRTLTDVSNFWQSKYQMLKFYKALNFRANELHDHEIQALLENSVF